VGHEMGEFTVQHLDDIAKAVEKFGARLAILAVPADNAQDVADQLISAGIRGLLNFAPVSITVPKGVAVNTVDVAVQLEQLAFQVTFLE